MDTTVTGVLDWSDRNADRRVSRAASVKPPGAPVGLADPSRVCACRAVEQLPRWRSAREAHQALPDALQRAPVGERDEQRVVAGDAARPPPASARGRAPPRWRARVPGTVRTTSSSPAWRTSTGRSCSSLPRRSSPLCSTVVDALRAARTPGTPSRATLDQPQLGDVAADRRLGGPEAPLAQRRRELLLGPDRPLLERSRMACWRSCFITSMASAGHAGASAPTTRRERRAGRR